MVGGEVLELGDVDIGRLGPIEHREQISVRQREVIAHQILVLAEMPVQHLKTLQQLFAEQLFGLFRHGRIEQGRKSLVKLSGDEVEPTLHLGAIERTGGGRQLLLRHLVGDILHDRRSLGQDGAIVEFERRHVAVRVLLLVDI